MQNELVNVKRDIVEIKTTNQKLEGLMFKLAQSTGFCNEVLSELTSNITNIVSSEVKNQIKEEFVTAKEEIQGSIIETVSENVKDTVKIELSKRGLNRGEAKKLTEARNSKMRELLGYSKGDRYILFSPFYQAQMRKEYNKLFECNAYADVDANRLEEAIQFITNFTISKKYDEWCECTLHKNYKNEEIESVKKLNAYKRFYGLAEQ